MATGLRRGEIVHLERRDVDWQARTATIRGPKIGEDRVTPLSDDAIAALRSLPARLDEPRLFPFNGAQVSVAFERALARAEIENFRLHDFAAHGREPARDGRRAVQESLGHKTLAMVQRYAHLSSSHLHEAVGRIALQPTPTGGG